MKPGEKPPVLPAGARRNIPAAADAYARYWIATLDWAYATTDSTLAKTVYTRSCTGCALFTANEIDKRRRQGDSFRGGRLEPVGSNLVTNDHHDGATSVWDITVQQERLKIVDRLGNTVGTVPASQAVFRTWLKWTTVGWRVVDWRQVVTK